MYYFKLKEINEFIIDFVGEERYKFLKEKKGDNVLILFDGGEIISDVGLYFKDIPELENKKTGYIGIIHHITTEINKTDDSILLKLAEQYLKKVKCEKIITPLDRDTWSPYRVQVSTKLDTPFFGEPYDGKNQIQTYRSNDFKIKYNYFSTISDFTYKEEKEIENYTFRFLTQETLEKDIESIYELSTEEFKNNLFYGNSNKDAFITQYTQLFYLLKPFICLAEQDNKIIGFLMGYEGKNCLKGQKCYVMKTTAVKKEHRNKGLASELYKRVANKAYTVGCNKLIGALIYEENCSHKLTKQYNSEIVSEYALLEKDI